MERVCGGGEGDEGGGGRGEEISRAQKGIYSLECVSS